MKDFNGGYIKASQKAYALLAEVYKDKSEIMMPFENNYLIVFQGIFVIAQNKGGADKQFYINNGALSWDEPKEWVKHIVKEGSRSHVISYSTLGQKCSEPMCEINKPSQINSMEDLNELPITNDDGEEVSILGFEYPMFECEIFFTDRLGVTHGRVDNDSIRWNKKGMSFTHPDNYNLTPIKPKWYEDETAKDLLQNTRKNITELISFTSDIKVAEKFSDIREILDSLYCEG